MEVGTGQPCPANNNIINGASSTVHHLISRPPRSLQGGEWEKNDRHRHQQGLRVPPRLTVEEEWVGLHPTPRLSPFYPYSIFVSDPFFFQDYKGEEGYPLVGVGGD